MALMQAFTYESLSARVIFGSGVLRQLAEEVDRLSMRRVLVLSTPQQRGEADALMRELGPRAAGIFSGATMHTPVNVTETALRQILETRADGVLAVGGGSTIGLGKAIALRTDFPQIAVPTTYAGSEVTPILGETNNGLKTTQRSAKVLPETVIYDVDLTLGLPPAMSATSGINAIAHAIEALYATDTNPIISLMAEEGIAALARSLPLIVRNGSDRPARSAALYGAWLCGTCLGAVGMALHHKLCHTLGGSFDLPHAETHTIVLPHVIAYNSASAPEAMARAARALGTGDASTGMYQLATALGAKTALRDLGMPADGIELAADLASEGAYPNPRPIERSAIRDLIARAWAGDPPRA